MGRKVPFLARGLRGGVLAHSNNCPPQIRSAAGPRGGPPGLPNRIIDAPEMNGFMRVRLRLPAPFPLEKHLQFGALVKVPGFFFLAIEIDCPLGPFPYFPCKKTAKTLKPKRPSAQSAARPIRCADHEQLSSRPHPKRLFGSPVHPP